MKIKPIFIYLFCALGGLLFGIDSGIISGAMTPIRQFMEQNGSYTEAMQGFMTSAVLFGSAFAALIVGKLSDKFGRKKLLVSAAIIFFVGALACGFVTTFTFLVFWRVVLGCGIGIASAIVPSYIAELVPSKSRGTYATMFQFFIIAGLCVAYVIDYIFIPVTTVAGFQNWQLMLGFAAVPALVLLAGATFVPESPRFLVKQGNTEKAREVLMHLRHNNTAEVETEIADIELMAQEKTAGFVTLFKVARPALIAACGLAFLQQFVGCNLIFYYGPVVAAGIMPFHGTAGTIAALEYNQLWAVVFGVANVIATGIGVAVMPKFKNRSLLYAGAVVMGVSVLLLGLADSKLHIINLPGLVQVALVIIYMIGFAFSWGPIIWNTIGEIFPLQVRGVGSSVATFVNWIANGVLMTLAPIIISQKADGTTDTLYRGWFIFGACCIVCILFTKFFVPETKGKSLEEIEASLRSKSNSL
ncbi:MAG: sugar porter family MFS transporter [Lactobacillales bacterium]|nr:sugar porter family MFS transporter [Lactobacillales bacterium]